MLSEKEKELVALGAAVGANCRSAIGDHVLGAREAGATDDEIHKTFADASCVKKNSKELTDEEVNMILGVTTLPTESCCPDGSTRVKELVQIASAIAVNCVFNLEKHLKAASNLALPEDDVMESIEVAQLVRADANSIVDRRARMGMPQSCCAAGGECAC